MVYFKLAISVLLAYSAIVQLFTHQTWWFIQNVNLIFHEAGHVLFMFFGNTLYTLGGSLTEIGIPLIITLYFIFKRQHFSAMFGCWWLSTAFLSVSIYASDAQERVLPLLGGDSVSHDWYVLLSRWGLIQYDDLIGYVFWLGGIIAIAILLLLLTRDKDVTMLLSKLLPDETNIPQH